MNQRFFIKSYSENQITFSYIYNSRDLELETSASFRVLNHFVEPVCTYVLQQLNIISNFGFKELLYMYHKYLFHFNIQSRSLNQELTTSLPWTYLSLSSRICICEIVFKHIHIYENIATLFFIFFLFYNISAHHDKHLCYKLQIKKLCILEGSYW